MECFGKLHDPNAAECRGCIARFQCAIKSASNIQSLDTTIVYKFLKRKPVKFGRTNDGFMNNTISQLAWNALMSMDGQFDSTMLGNRALIYATEHGMKSKNIVRIARKIIHIASKRGVVKRIKRGIYELR